jgi:hypothetical protein
MECALVLETGPISIEEVVTPSKGIGKRPRQGLTGASAIQKAWDEVLYLFNGSGGT